MGGAVFGARITGQDGKFSLALGALLNTRGLVELIVLNIAYSAHVFSPTLYTVRIVMAVVTTAVTVPILNRLKVGNRSGERSPRCARTQLCHRGSFFGEPRLTGGAVVVGMHISC